MIAFPLRRTERVGAERLSRNKEFLRECLLEKDGWQAAPVVIGSLFFPCSCTFRALSSQVDGKAVGVLIRRFIRASLQMIHSWIVRYEARTSDHVAEKMVMSISADPTQQYLPDRNTHTHTHTHTHAHTHTLARAHACTHMCARTQSPRHTQASFRCVRSSCAHKQPCT
jgi:hypothetical protein